MRLTVVGLGCGSPDLLTGSARDAVAASGVLFVTARYRDIVSFHPNVKIMKNLRDALDEAESAVARQNVAIGVSGDPGMYSMMGMICDRFSGMDGVELAAIPGVGSLSYFFAKLRADWSDVRVLSGHGRALCENALLRAAARNEKTVVFCGPERNPAWVCGVLDRYVRDFYDGEPDPFRIAVGENLSLDGERISIGSVSEMLSSGCEFHHHALTAIFNANPDRDSAAIRPRDDDFIRIRGNVPITRQEVRSAILDELRLDEDSVVWDVGAGTGSVSVACARVCGAGEVHAIEQKSEAIDIIMQNRKKFRAFNLRVHRGSAPEALYNLPRPTHVFVGGSGGRMGGILDRVSALGEGVRVCVSSVTLETLADVSGAMRDGRRFKNLDVVNIAVTRARPLGDVSLMAAQNPVTLWTAVTAEDRKGGNSR
jgi:precorrin-6Y C5,15-methyltransferase (decarboxylating)